MRVLTSSPWRMRLPTSWMTVLTRRIGFWPTLRWRSLALFRAAATISFSISFRFGGIWISPAGAAGWATGIDCVMGFWPGKSDMKILRRCGSYPDQRLAYIRAAVEDLHADPDPEAHHHRSRRQQAEAHRGVRRTRELENVHRQHRPDEESVRVGGAR